MAIWAFACKNESSDNRWFDGTGQYVYPVDTFEKELVKNVNDIKDFNFLLFVEWKVLRKSVGAQLRGLGSNTLNSGPLNGDDLRITNYTNSISMRDSVVIDYSQEVIWKYDSVGVNDTGGVSKSVGKDYKFDIIPGDETNINLNNDSTFAIENLAFREECLIGFSRTIPGSAEDSFTFDDSDFIAKIGGKSLRETITIAEVSVEKEIDNVIGDERINNSLNIGTMNASAINSDNNKPKIITQFGFEEEVNIIMS